MQRVLFEIGAFQVQTYGFMIALAILAALFVAYKEGERKSLGGENVVELSLYIIVFGVIGARLAYILAYNPLFYLTNPLEIIKIHQGGLAIHGAIAAGVLAGIILTRRNKLSFWKLADTLAPASILALGIGRIGCDVFGKPMSGNWPWGVMVNNQLLHPAQVYEFILNFILFFILWRKRKNLVYNGQLFLWFIIGYNINRGLVEFFRVNPAIYEPFTIGHLASFIFIAGGIIINHIIKTNKLKINAAKKKSNETGIKGEAKEDNFWLQLCITLALIIISLTIYYGFGI